MDIRYFGTTPRYSEAVCAGGLIFLSGMVPENGETAAEQTADVLAQPTAAGGMRLGQGTRFGCGHLPA